MKSDSIIHEIITPNSNYTTSRYNHFFPLEKGCLAYNAFSNSLAWVSEENFQLLHQILENPNQNYNNERDVKLKHDLIRGGFLKDAAIDERELLKVQNMAGRFGGNSLGITVAPTTQCIFSCSYCFEGKKEDTMTVETEKALLDFVDKKLDFLKYLNVTWFGGEPLMRIDSIQRLSEGFKNICQTHEAKFNPASIITNGFLLSKENAQKLRNANIQSAQVTLDGSAIIHDQRRKLKNGKGTFQNILENIKESMDVLKILVRINVDKENANEMLDFFDLWEREGLGDKVAFYFGQVQSNTAACADISGQCLSTREFSRLIIELLGNALERGIFNIRYPSLYKSGFCGADNLNSYVVSPSGKLFKCWEEICDDSENSIGNLFTVNPSPKETANNTKYLGWDSFSNEQCKECNVFPVCGGGCIYNALKSPDKTDCGIWKYNLREVLLLKYSELKQFKKAKEGQQK